MSNQKTKPPRLGRRALDADALSPLGFGLWEAIAKFTAFWCFHALFLLTPALSLRERGHHRQCIRQSEPLGVVATPSLVLPLPEGEGRGEGERALEIADRWSFAIGFWLSDFPHVTQLTPLTQLTQLTP